MKKHFLKNVLFFALMASCIFRPMVGLDSIKNIKGLFRYVKKEKLHLSPLHGCVWWEMGIIETIYRIGLVHKTEKEWDNKVDKTTELVHFLFELTGEDFYIQSHNGYPFTGLWHSI